MLMLSKDTMPDAGIVLLRKLEYADGCDCTATIANNEKTKSIIFRKKINL